MSAFQQGRWADDQTELCKQMYWNGASVQDIKDACNASSVNAVQKKISREAMSRNPELAKARASAPYEIPFFAVPSLRENGALVTIETVAIDECRFIYSEASIDAAMCARPITRGVYCAKHWELCHQRVPAPC